MIKQYIKKPIPIEAVQWTGKNQEEINRFCNKISFYYSEESKLDLYIDTLEGRMRVNIGDYIIRGPFKEFYPCKEEIFNATYTEC